MRQSRRDYENEVFYEVWRAGGNPDTIDFDHVEDHWWDGDSYETAARCVLRRQRPEPEPEGEDSRGTGNQPPEEIPVVDDEHI